MIVLESALPWFADDGFGKPPGHLVFALVAPLSADALDQWARQHAPFDNAEQLACDPSADWERDYAASAWVQLGEAAHSAFICTCRGSASTEEVLARKLRSLTSPVYALHVEGMDDPDDGYPYVDVYAKGCRRQRLWSMLPDDVVSKDHDPQVGPWELARSLGIELPPYRSAKTTRRARRSV